MAEKTDSDLMLESGSAPPFAQADVVSQNSSSKSELVDEVFALFKGYLTSSWKRKGSSLNEVLSPIRKPRTLSIKATESSSK